MVVTKYTQNGRLKLSHFEWKKQFFCSLELRFILRGYIFLFFSYRDRKRECRVSQRQIARKQKISRNTVKKYIENPKNPKNAFITGIHGIEASAPMYSVRANVSPATPRNTNS